MGKIIFWIVVFIAILLVVRIVNLSKAKSRDEQSRRDRKAIPPAEPTVRCVECGVFVPKSESMPVPTGFRCSPDCTRRR